MSEYLRKKLVNRLIDANEAKDLEGPLADEILEMVGEELASAKQRIAWLEERHRQQTDKVNP